MQFLEVSFGQVLGGASGEIWKEVAPHFVLSRRGLLRQSAKLLQFYNYLYVIKVVRREGRYAISNLMNYANKVLPSLGKKRNTLVNIMTANELKAYADFYSSVDGLSATAKAPLLLKEFFKNIMPMIEEVEK